MEARPVFTSESSFLTFVARSTEDAPTVICAPIYGEISVSETEVVLGPEDGIAPGRICHPLRFLDTMFKRA